MRAVVDSVCPALSSEQLFLFDMRSVGHSDWYIDLMHNGQCLTLSQLLKCPLVTMGGEQIWIRKGVARISQTCIKIVLE